MNKHLHALVISLLGIAFISASVYIYKVNSDRLEEEYQARIKVIKELKCNSFQMEQILSILSTMNEGLDKCNNITTSAEKYEKCLDELWTAIEAMKNEQPKALKEKGCEPV